MTQVLTWYQGDTKRLTVDVQNSVTGEPIDISGSTIQFTFTNKRSGAVALTKSVGSGITILDTSQFVITVDAADTEDLARGDYQAQVYLTLASGDAATVLDFIVTLKERYS